MLQFSASAILPLFFHLLAHSFDKEFQCLRLHNLGRCCIVFLAWVAGGIFDWHFQVAETESRWRSGTDTGSMSTQNWLEIFWYFYLLTLGLDRLYFQISLPFQVHFQNWFHHAWRSCAWACLCRTSFSDALMQTTWLLLLQIAGYMASFVSGVKEKSLSGTSKLLPSLGDAWQTHGCMGAVIVISCYFTVFTFKLISSNFVNIVMNGSKETCNKSRCLDDANMSQIAVRMEWFAAVPWSIGIFSCVLAEDEGNAKTVKLQSYDSSVTMKEAVEPLRSSSLESSLLTRTVWSGADV